MKKVFLFIAAALMSAMTWAETATSTFTDKNWTVGEGEEAWVAAGAATNSFDSQNGRGVQITLKNIQADGLTLTNSSIKDLGDISKVEVVYSSNCEGSEDGTIAVTVGATAFGEAFTIKKENNATISFENETAVAGDIVITFTSTATSKSVYVKSITVTYGSAPTPATLDSIVIRGEATKMEYKVGEAFDTDGLEVWGFYTKTVKHDSISQIKSGITWTLDPETFEEADDNGSVTLVASYKELTTADTTITGIKVTEKPAPSGYAETYTSNVELSTEGGTSASAAKVVIGEDEYDAIKAGATKTAGACVVTIPTNTKTLHFHAAGWKGENVTLDVNGTEYTLTADAGVTSNTPFTLQNNPAEVEYFTLDPKGATTITFAAKAGKRFVLFGVNAELEDGPVTGIREAMVNANVRKAMVNGRLIIVKGEKAFDLQGRIVK